MRLSFSPVRMDVEGMVIMVEGDTLTINNEALDFGLLQEGDILPAGAVDSKWVTGDITRRGVSIELTVVLPHGPNASHQRRFPEPVSITDDGKVDLPPYDEPPTQTELTEIPATDEVANGTIDWSQRITAQMIAERKVQELLAQTQAETARLRKVADDAIAPLQDAVDLDEATEAEALRLKEWKRYRVALNRLPDQPGYPTAIDWPAPPA